MSDIEEKNSAEETATIVLGENRKKNKTNMFLIWTLALIIGAGAGCLGINALNEFFNFVALVFTRIFKFIAIPTVALAVMTTLSTLGANKKTGRMFAHTVTYTLLTTFAAAIVALILFYFFNPGIITLPNVSSSAVDENLASMTYYEHILSVIPDNILQPLVSGNVLSVIIVAAVLGIGLSRTSDSENKSAFIKAVHGLQEVLFTIIRGILKVLPLGIAAFAAQLATQITTGSAIGVLGKYTTVVLAGNLIQIVVIIPLFLAIKGLNPFKIFAGMSKALIVAFFTKSSAGTLPVTLSCAENNLKTDKEVSRFVLPICTTVNMNGCAAFILITSLFVMQNSGMTLNLPTMIMWLFIAVFAAIGNAGVPMGCYFLTLSLMSSIGANLGILGVILPIYTVIDMVETVENVWSDSAVCAVTNKDLSVKN